MMTMEELVYINTGGGGYEPLGIEMTASPQIQSSVRCFITWINQGNWSLVGGGLRFDPPTG